MSSTAYPSLWSVTDTESPERFLEGCGQRHSHPDRALASHAAGPMARESDNRQTACNVLGPAGRVDAESGHGVNCARGRLSGPLPRADLSQSPGRSRGGNPQPRRPRWRQNGNVGESRERVSVFCRLSGMKSCRLADQRKTGETTSTSVVRRRGPGLLRANTLLRGVCGPRARKTQADPMPQHRGRRRPR